MDEILDEGIFERHQPEDPKLYKTYKSFHSVAEAASFARFLSDHEVLFLAEKSETIIDEAIVGTGLLPNVLIKLKPEDFKRVNALIEEQLSQVDFSEVEEHYLSQLDDKELLEIFKEPDKWSIEDINIAKIILRGRSINVTDEHVRELREKRMEEIRQGKKGNRFLMMLYFLGILLGLFTTPLFIVAGIGMGYYYAYGKAVDPDGNKYFVFEPETRNYGIIILYGGIAMLVLALILFFAMAY